MPQFAVGQEIAGHRIEEVAGRGGMGVVYRVRHLALDVSMALKLIADELAADAEFRERFQREARLAAQLRHPNVVRVIDAGEVDGLLYVTMDYVEGLDLRQVIARDTRLEPERAVRIVEQVAGALDAAHDRGFIHRDVKPANILVEEVGGREMAYLTDFGLTKQAAVDSGLTRTGTWIGTLDYMAPEQIKGSRVNRPTDVYALAGVLFHMLVGHAPFPLGNDTAIMSAHLFNDPPRPSAEVPSLPPGFDEVIAKGMAKEERDRLPTAGALARAARAALEGRPVTPSSPGPAPGEGTVVVPRPRTAPAQPVPPPPAAPSPAHGTAVPPPSPAYGTTAPPPSPAHGIAAPPPSPAHGTAVPPPPHTTAYGPQGTAHGAGAAPSGRRRWPIVLAVGIGVLCAIALVAVVIALSSIGGSEPASEADARAAVDRFEDALGRADRGAVEGLLTDDARSAVAGDAEKDREGALADLQALMDGGDRPAFTGISVTEGEEAAEVTARYETAGTDADVDPAGSVTLEAVEQDGEVRFRRIETLPDLPAGWNVPSDEAPTTLTIRATAGGAQVGELPTTPLPLSQEYDLLVPLTDAGRRHVREGAQVTFDFEALATLTGDEFNEREVLTLGRLRLFAAPEERARSDREST